jgi:hypothetical protein
MHMLVALQRPAYAAGNPLALIELPTAAARAELADVDVTGYARA